MHHLFLFLAFATISPAPSSTAAAANAYSLGCPGMSGIDARPGYSSGGSAPDGYKGFRPGGRGGDGQRGRDGGNASPATAGGNGCAIEALLEKDPQDSTKLLLSGTMGGRPFDEKIDFNDSTSISLNASGGRGGNGAGGGNGQDGGRGGEGGDTGQHSFSSGSGGRGGDGGNGGQSSSGANGGNGGTIVLRVRKGQEALADLVTANVSGGQGGNRPFSYTRGGRGGQGGQPGNNCYFSSEGYKCVSRGSPGMRGMDGRAPFSNPQSGLPGRVGTYLIEAID